MTVPDILHETYAALSANKVRTALTMLGIIIGISSVIAMVSIGQGAQVQIQSSIEGLGSNLLTILPGVVQPGRGIVSSGRGSAQTLKNADLDVLKQIDGIAAISPEVSRRFQVTAPTGNNTNTTVTGAVADYSFVHNIVLAEGNFLTDADERSIGRTAVLGATVATDLFADADPLGKTIRINQSTFHIIGVLTKKGGAGFSGPDDMIFVPLSTMQKVLSGVDYLSTISVSVTNKDQMNTVRDAATNALLAKHRVAEADFSIISQEDILGTLSQVINTFTLFLASIAGISLVVGGIGIMNMMLTTVTERTKEIGLRKAIGAKKKDINLQFLAEAVALTFIGGAVGIILGWAICYAVTSLGILQTSVSLTSVILAFGVSAAIGIIFGYYPARRASSLNPIEALRYE
ncbi:MAG: ABC transporter permease [Candidatus Pacebacteria bacterium]|nr:ABC transporter permease [Candidatus Paceibacterota bacterium]